MPVRKAIEPSRHARNRKILAGLIFNGLLLAAAGMTFWWINYRNQPRVKLLPTSTEFESYPVSSSYSERG